MKVRKGLTLTELLIVIAIMVILLGAALPLMRAGLKDRKIREASREVNTFFSVAKAKAVETGLPVGVEVTERKLTIMETPPAYIGDVANATALLMDQLQYDTSTGSWVGSAKDGVPETARFDAGACASLQSLVKVGDFIQFDFKGPYYQIAAIHPPGPKNYPAGAPNPAPPPVPLNTIEVTFFLDPTRPLMQPAARPISDPMAGQAGMFPVRFQIYREPIKSSLRELELPSNVIIDLKNSGYGLTGREYLRVLPDGTEVPVEPTIVFAPSGEVVRVTTDQGHGVPLDIIHLLVGTLEGAVDNSDVSPLPRSASDSTPVIFKANLSNTENLWVSVNPQSGQVSTAANSWLLASPTAGSGPFFLDSLGAAREFAQRSLVVGGQ